jgi:methyl-accepting chemotaxis protein
MDRIARDLKDISSPFSRTRLIGAIPILIAMILSGAVSFGYNFLLKESGKSVDHTFLVLSKIDAVLLRLQDAETGQRGFIITADDAYLAPFVAAEEQAFGALADLGGLISDNADQKSRVEKLQQLANTKFSELKQTIETRRHDGFEAARLSVLRSSGKETMDQMRSITGAMREKEQALLENRLTDLHWAEGLMLVIAAFGVALSLGGRFIASLVRARMGKA